VQTGAEYEGAAMTELSGLELMRDKFNVFFMLCIVYGACIGAIFATIFRIAVEFAVLFWRYKP
jgi:hypothetical protein